MTNAMPRLSNTQARALFLAHHGLSQAPSGQGKGEDLRQVISALGFVQVDSINTVSRAQHMILHARRQQYREKHLAPLLERERSVFEHWTHDASVISAEFFPHWRLRFARDADRLSSRWKSWRRDGFEQKFDEILKQISDHGPVCSADVGVDEKRSSGGWWDWHPSKTALEYLWRTGALSVTRREGFRKMYDLTENVILPEHLNARHETAETIDWACASALDRLGFATSGELAAFWDLITPVEAKDWCATALKNGDIIEIEITCEDGKLRRCFARPDVVDNVDKLPEMPGAIRILSPFDPALRDRNRAERLFGFNYRIEIFVPEAKRKYGYYVFPVLEGDRLIGRIDMKASKADNCLTVRAFWPEPRVRMGKARRKRLMTAIERTARLAGVSDIKMPTDQNIAGSAEIA